MAETLFGNLAPDGGSTNLVEAGGLTLGTAWYSTVDGYVTSIRWRFPDTLPSGAVTGALYAVTSNLTAVERATKAFTSPVAGDWNVATLDTPAAVAANTLQVVAVATPDRYVARAGQFSAAATVSGNLTAIRDATDPTGQFGELIRNGRFKAGALGFPTSTFGGNGYLVDIEFVTELGGDEVANPQHVTLTANTEAVLTLDANYGLIEVTQVANPAVVYFNVKDSAIGSVAGNMDGNQVLPAVLCAKTVLDETSGVASKVRLRSAGTPTISVRGI